MSEPPRHTTAASAPSFDLATIVKAYDVRGTVPDQMNADVAHALGVGFARFAGAPRILVGRDMRPSGPELVDAFARGVMEQGVDVVDLGLASTDLVYYAAGTLDAPGAVFTASHNPAQYNGVKFCLSGARPVGQDTGLTTVRDIAQSVLDGTGPLPAARAGSQSSRNLLSAFADHVVGFVDTTALRPLRVVADTANGMGGLVVPAVFERIPQITLEVMYGELDGTFPNHPADPLQPENQRDLQARVVAGGFDVGLAFDGDADRVFVVDEAGRGLSGSTTTAILASTILRSHPGRHHPAQPHLQSCRARGGARARRRAGSHQGRSLVHQAGHGRDRRGVRWRTLGALLLPRQLPGRQRADRQHVRARRAQPCAQRPVGGPQALRALLGQRRDQHPRRRPVGGHRACRGSVRRTPIRTASTASPSTADRGGSTCVPRTPSRCCA